MSTKYGSLQKAFVFYQKLGQLNIFIYFGAAMLTKAIKIFNVTYNSLPIQLLVWQLRKNYLLLFFWLMLFAIANNWGQKFGVPFLFFEPEYMGKTSPTAFFIMGLCFGGFLIAYNTANYITHLEHIRFIGYIRRPFLTYYLNNALLPIAFVVFFNAQLYKFKLQQGIEPLLIITYAIFPFILGILLLTTAGVLYFFSTNNDALSLLQKNVEQTLKTRFFARQFVLRQNASLTNAHTNSPISGFLNVKLQWQACNTLKPVSKQALKLVFRQNQTNAIAIQAISFASLLALSIFKHWAWLNIPAAASLFVTLALFTLVLGAFNFWFGQWRITAFVVLLVFVNALFPYLPFQTQAKIYGLDYTKPKPYNNQLLSASVRAETITSDSLLAIKHLNNWKENIQKSKPWVKKPTMFIICTSGGGLRAAIWTAHALQQADSAFGGELMQWSTLITGASGGMLGASFYRAYYQEQQAQKTTTLPNFLILANNLGKDLLNSIFFTITTNDLFFSLKKITYNQISYRYDRGTALEEGIKANSLGWLSKPFLADSTQEIAGLLPRLILSPTIANDGRRLLISSLPAAYLAATHSGGNMQVDGIDFFPFFTEQKSQNLSLITAIRLNATFPYISPNVILPTTPQIEVLDAGLRDNYGLELAMRYLLTFRDWIHLNVQQVVLLQIRDTPSQIAIDSLSKRSWAATLTAPINSLTRNWKNFQEYNLNRLLAEATEVFPNNFNWLCLQLGTEKGSKQVSLSWYLTNAEKQLIAKGISQPQNAAVFKQLEALGIEARKP